MVLPEDIRRVRFRALCSVSGMKETAAQGLSMNAKIPYLIMETDGNKRFLLQDPTTLGRLPENDLPLADAGCSNHHAVLRREGGRWTLEDLGSTNGTWVNDQRLEQPHLLKNADRIQLGAQLLKVGGLESHCSKCGKELPLEAVFCPGCGLQLGKDTPPPTVMIAPPSLAPHAPPPLPPTIPTHPPPVPAAADQQKKRGCWLSCCLVSVILLLLAGMAAWFLWDRLFKYGPSSLLGKTLACRQLALFDSAPALAKRADRGYDPSRSCCARP